MDLPDRSESRQLMYDAEWLAVLKCVTSHITSHHITHITSHHITSHPIPSHHITSPHHVHARATQAFEVFRRHQPALPATLNAYGQHAHSVTHTHTQQ